MSWLFTLIGGALIMIIVVYLVHSGRADGEYYGRDGRDWSPRGGEGDYSSSDGGGDGGGD